MSDTSIATASTLPVTGTGPFTVLLGVLGLASIATGAAIKWAAGHKRDDSNVSE